MKAVILSDKYSKDTLKKIMDILVGIQKYGNLKMVSILHSKMYFSDKHISGYAQRESDGAILIVFGKQNKD